MRFSLRNSHIVISLSTTPYRIGQLDKVIKAIIDQNVTTNAIYLNVPYKFKRDNLDYYIPASLAENSKITILRTEDYGPATKLLGTLKAVNLPAESIIVTLDDDIEYPDNIVLHLAYAAKNNPSYAIGLSGAGLYNGFEPMSKLDRNLGLTTKYNYKGDVTILQGYSGIAYQYRFFQPDVFDIANYPSSCVKSDDLYLSFYLAKQNIGRKTIANEFIHTFKIAAETTMSTGSDALQNLDPPPPLKHAQCLAYLRVNFPTVDFSNNYKNNSDTTNLSACR